jgi:hypothetical protein
MKVLYFIFLCICFNTLDTYKGNVPYFSMKNQCELYEEDSNISNIDEFKKPLADFYALEADRKFLHLRSYDGTPKLYRKTIIKELNGSYNIVVLDFKEGKEIREVGSKRLYNSFENFSSYYASNPASYFSFCNSATGGSFDLFLLQENEHIVFKYVSADRQYEALKEEDKDKIAPAINFFRLLKELEKNP